MITIKEAADKLKRGIPNVSDVSFETDRRGLKDDESVESSAYMLVYTGDEDEPEHTILVPLLRDDEQYELYFQAIIDSFIKKDNVPILIALRHRSQYVNPIRHVVFYNGVQVPIFDGYNVEIYKPTPEYLKSVYFFVDGRYKAVLKDRAKYVDYIINSADLRKNPCNAKFPFYNYLLPESEEAYKGNTLFYDPSAPEWLGVKIGESWYWINYRLFVAVDNPLYSDELLVIKNLYGE